MKIRKKKLTRITFEIPEMFIELNRDFERFDKRFKDRARKKIKK